MNRIRKMVIGTAIAVAAVGGPVAMAATSASAATVSPAHTVSAQLPILPHQWKLNGPNVLRLTTGGHNYLYPAILHTVQVGPNLEVVSGFIHDGYEPVPVNLPIQGVIFGKDVVLSVQYPTVGPDAGPQGDRTVSGKVGVFGHVGGTFTETGPANESGTFGFFNPAH